MSRSKWTSNEERPVRQLYFDYFNISRKSAATRAQYLPEFKTSVLGTPGVPHPSRVFRERVGILTSQDP